MAKRTCFSLLLFLVLTAYSPQRAWAGMTFLGYAGNGLNIFSNSPLVPGKPFNLLAELTLSSSLAANLNDAELDPLDWEISDGPFIDRRANCPTCASFRLSTDGLGRIVGWNFVLDDKQIPFGTQQLTWFVASTSESGGTDFTQAGISNSSEADIGFNTGRPGAWTTFEAAEPSSLSLLLLGFAAGSFCLLKKRGKKTATASNF